VSVLSAAVAPVSELVVEVLPDIADFCLNDSHLLPPFVVLLGNQPQRFLMAPDCCNHAIYPIYHAVYTLCKLVNAIGQSLDRLSVCFGLNFQPSDSFGVGKSLSFQPGQSLGVCL
jgi:hypothetical protein